LLRRVSSQFWPTFVLYFSPQLYFLALSSSSARPLYRAPTLPVTKPPRGSWIMLQDSPSKRWKVSSRISSCQPCLMMCNLPNLLAFYSLSSLFPSISQFNYGRRVSPAAAAVMIITTVWTSNVVPCYLMIMTLIRFSMPFSFFFSDHVFFTLFFFLFFIFFCHFGVG